jgi:hypothetical protein
VTINDASAYYLWGLLRLYGLSYPLLASANRIVKLWAKAHNVLGALHGRMNSISWIILVTHFAIRSKRVQAFERSVILNNKRRIMELVPD